MRWMWIDRFLEFESGVSAVSIKNTTLSDPSVDEYMPAINAYPHALIIEGMAQTAGLLVGEAKGFETRVVLAKVSRAEFHRAVLPGSQLRFSAQVEDIQDDGAITSGAVTVNGEPQADISLVFAHLDGRFPDRLFDPHMLLAMLRLLCLYEVGRDSQGQPLAPPPHLLQAEAREFDHD